MTGFRIITADERMAETRYVKGVIAGPHGIGKTTLLKTLDPAKTLFLNLEAGDLAVQDFPVDSINIQTWDQARELACLTRGPNPALRSDQPYSQAHYDYCCSQTDPKFLDKYSIYFWDSISVAARLCLQWCGGQPKAFSEKSGKPDNRGLYGLLGRELIDWFTEIQHTNKHVWLVGGLDEKPDDFNRPTYSLQIDGAKAALELPGIFDEIISMVQLKTDDGQPYRAFVCHKVNPWGYPAKDRSTRLDMLERPHLGALMDKIIGPRPIVENVFTLPAAAPAESTPNPQPTIQE
jgi:hypothetical protein